MITLASNLPNRRALCTSGLSNFAWVVLYLRTGGWSAQIVTYVGASRRAFMIQNSTATLVEEEPVNAMQWNRGAKTDRGGAGEQYRTLLFRMPNPPFGGLIFCAGN